MFLHTWSSLNSVAETVASHPVAIGKCSFMSLFNRVNRKLHHNSTFFSAEKLDQSCESVKNFNKRSFNFKPSSAKCLLETE